MGPAPALVTGTCSSRKDKQNWPACAGPRCSSHALGGASGAKGLLCQLVGSIQANRAGPLACRGHLARRGCCQRAQVAAMAGIQVGVDGCWSHAAAAASRTGLFRIASGSRAAAPPHKAPCSCCDSGKAANSCTHSHADKAGATVIWRCWCWCGRCGCWCWCGRCGHACSKAELRRHGLLVWVARPAR